MANATFGYNETDHFLLSIQTTTDGKLPPGFPTTNWPQIKTTKAKRANMTGTQPKTQLRNNTWLNNKLPTQTMVDPDTSNLNFSEGEAQVDIISQ